MRIVKACIYVLLYTVMGILLFGVDAKPMEILAVYAVMHLAMISSTLEDINDKLKN